MLLYIALFVFVLSLVNLLRLVFFSVAGDIYDIRDIRNRKEGGCQSNGYFSKRYNPLITVVVPAHNEQRTLKRNLLSIADNSYKNVELIIANDTSDDKTGQIAQNFQRQYKKRFKKITVLNVNVRGKARAMNEALKYAHGSLFMCLDADSTLDKNALSEAVYCFREKNLGSLASNVKIIPSRGALNLIQRIEYLTCHQMKKAETVARSQYIVGGIGSMYRMRILRKLNYYDTNTITEDIDLSMKMLEHYGRSKFIGFNPKMIAFTEAVVSVSDLINQRSRWKYGRYQVFLKRKGLFYSRNKSHGKVLSWIYLPYALFGELAFATEPLTIGLIFYLVYEYNDYSMIIGAVLTFCFYTIIQVAGASQSYSLKERAKLSAFAPLAYIFMYILTFVEYVATIRGFLSIWKLIKEYRTGESGCEWTHVERSGSEAAAS